MGNGDLADVLEFKFEQLDALRDFLTEWRIVEFTGNQLATDNLARGCDGELQDDLALQGRVFPECAVVDAVDRSLVAVVYHLDFLDTAAGGALSPVVAGAACTAAGITCWAVNLCGFVLGQFTPTGIATQAGSLDAATGTRGT